VPGELTCGNCGHSWSSNATSARTRCGACRSVVYVPAQVRSGASSSGAERTLVAPSRRIHVNDEDEASPYSGATVLVARCHRIRRDHRRRWGHLAPSQRGSDAVYEGSESDCSHPTAVEPVRFRLRCCDEAFGAGRPAHDGSHDPVVLWPRCDLVRTVRPWRHGCHGSLSLLRS